LTRVGMVQSCNIF